ncbi:hypothetical protein BJV74DRAFT_92853 [Russula compacta]|nr:hypothetical protein BJV74DRAFT_92853 [Russula compacta]
MPAVAYHYCVLTHSSSCAPPSPSTETGTIFLPIVVYGRDFSGLFLSFARLTETGELCVRVCVPRWHRDLVRRRSSITYCQPVSYVRDQSSGFSCLCWVSVLFPNHPALRMAGVRYVPTCRATPLSMPDDVTRATHAHADSLDRSMAHAV